MQEKDFYQQILGLKSPWFVAEVKLDTASHQVDVYVEHPAATKFCCPDCQQELACYDHTEPRAWRHLDTMQFKTMLHAAIPRVKCPEHGVKQATVSWAEGSSRFTLLFERFAIDVLLATQNVKGAQSILKTGECVFLPAFAVSSQFGRGDCDGHECGLCEERQGKHSAGRREDRA